MIENKRLDTFRITYQERPGDARQTRVIDARTVDDALSILGTVHTVNTISMQCRGYKAKSNGTRCGRFSHDDYCAGHAK